jgi:myo-inositol-1(or 4)-monophosphatase
VIPVIGVIYHPVNRELFVAVRDNGATCNGKPIHVSDVTALKHGLLTTGFYYYKGDELRRQIDVFERVHQAVQTVRRPGSAALDLAYVAGGFFDAFWEKGLAPWDIASGLLLIEEAGGTVTDFGGDSATVVSTEIAASNGNLHDKLLVLLNARSED